MYQGTIFSEIYSDQNLSRRLVQNVGHVKHAAWRAIKSRQVVINHARGFFDFRVSKFAKNDDDDGHFIQKFFYVDNIDRDIDITASTTKGSDSWFSIRSTGTELVLEV